MEIEPVLSRKKHASFDISIAQGRTHDMLKVYLTQNTVRYTVYSVIHGLTGTRFGLQPYFGTS